MQSRYLHSFTLVLITLWLGWSVLVDFVVVPNVFAVISNFFEAGNLGMTLFSKFNNLELILATLLVAAISLSMRAGRKLQLMLILAILCWVIALTYFSWLSPKIITLTELWKKADAAGSTGIAGIADIQQAHQFYHRMYIWIDTVKMLLLAVLLVVTIRQQEKWQ